MKVVGLIGRLGSGKTTAADYLVEQYGFSRIKFADPLKDMLRAIGLTDDHIEGDLKEEPCDLLMGQTPRHAMQTLGTEWGRNCIDQNLWVRLWLERAGAKRMVVADDCRFPNEMETIRKNGGTLIRIVPQFPDFKDAPVTHESERYAMECDVHAEVLNNGSIKEMCQAVYSAVWS